MVFCVGVFVVFFGETRQVPQASVRSLNATLNSTRMPFNSERFHFGKVRMAGGGLSKVGSR